MAGEPQLACLDGRLMAAAQALVPATDEGLLRGDGVFEVMKLYGGAPFALEEHLRRLERSATNLRLPIDLQAVREDLLELLRARHEAEQAGLPAGEVVRVVLTRGGRRLLLTEEMPELRDRLRLRTITYAPTRILDGVKSLSYAANMLAGRLAREGGFDEALLVTPHGRVLEAPTSSIFWVREGEVYTPPLSDHILASITRALVIEVCGAAQRSCPLEELLAADEVFLASTLREVQPVAAVDGHAFSASAPHTARVAEGVQARIRERVARPEQG
jgi:branched-chain amino acid aminotransferase